MDKYQWPADKLTIKEMGILYQLKHQTGIPINKLIKKAVQIGCKSKRIKDQKRYSKN